MRVKVVMVIVFDAQGWITTMSCNADSDLSQRATDVWEGVGNVESCSRLANVTRIRFLEEGEHSDWVDATEAEIEAFRQVWVQMNLTSGIQ